MLKFQMISLIESKKINDAFLQLEFTEVIVYLYGMMRLYEIAHAKSLTLP